MSDCHSNLEATHMCACCMCATHMHMHITCTYMHMHMHMSHVHAHVQVRVHVAHAHVHVHVHVHVTCACMCMACASQLHSMCMCMCMIQRCATLCVTVTAATPIEARVLGAAQKRGVLTATRTVGVTVTCAYSRRRRRHRCRRPRRRRPRRRRPRRRRLGSARTGSSLAMGLTMMKMWPRLPMAGPASGGAALRMRMDTSMLRKSMGSETRNGSE